ncbi:four helix bundle protein [Patescibacteria group bacterium]|nr:four helix bundle protein [Patescibacteria group bacterium]
MKQFDLEERLVKFAISILNISELLAKTYAGIHISKQIIRSGTSPALNYAEALGGESRKDFIHKIKIALKELRETHICLRIIKGKPLIKEGPELEYIAKECNELISIFVTSIKTADKNMKKE